jgi:hypothetical protein
VCFSDFLVYSQILLFFTIRGGTIFCAHSSKLIRWALHARLFRTYIRPSPWGSRQKRKNHKLIRWASISYVRLPRPMREQPAEKNSRERLELGSTRAGKRLCWLSSANSLKLSIFAALLFSFFLFRFIHFTSFDFLPFQVFSYLQKKIPTFKIFVQNFKKVQIFRFPS